MAESKEFKTWMAAHNAMLAAYRTGDFDCAMQDIKEAGEAMAAAESSLANYYEIYQKRIIDLVKNPPGDAWDGVFIAKNK